MVNENYYLVGFDSTADDFRHYRVDKMIHTEEIKDKRQGSTRYKTKDKDSYSRMRFRMFDGEEIKVTLRCKNEIANVIIDQFGRDIQIQKLKNGEFKARVEVAVSDQFLGWILALRGKVVIESPKSVKDRFVELMQENMGEV